jgi:hypothetical protein
VTTPLERVRAATADYSDIGRVVVRIRGEDVALLLALVDRVDKYLDEPETEDDPDHYRSMRDAYDALTKPDSPECLPKEKP